MALRSGSRAGPGGPAAGWAGRIHSGPATGWAGRVYSGPAAGWAGRVHSGDRTNGRQQGFSRRPRLLKIRKLPGNFVSPRNSLLWGGEFLPVIKNSLAFCTLPPMPIPVCIAPALTPALATRCPHAPALPAPPCPTCSPLAPFSHAEHSQPVQEDQGWHLQPALPPVPGGKGPHPTHAAGERTVNYRDTSIKSTLGSTRMCSHSICASAPPVPLPCAFADRYSRRTLCIGDKLLP